MKPDHEKSYLKLPRLAEQLVDEFNKMALIVKDIKQFGNRDYLKSNYEKIAYNPNTKEKSVVKLSAFVVFISFKNF